VSGPKREKSGQQKLIRLDVSRSGGIAIISALFSQCCDVVFFSIFNNLGDTPEAGKKTAESVTNIISHYSNSIVSMSSNKMTHKVGMGMKGVRALSEDRSFCHF